MKRTPLKSKRETPRRKAPERVEHTRIKAKAGAVPTTEEAFHMGVVSAMPCIICGKHGPSTVHHVRHHPERTGTHARDHKRVVPLCPAHHLHDHGPDSVERIHESGILKKFGINLWDEGGKLWEERDGF